jgi:uncharacterized protein (TIGR02001 family)
MGHGGRRRHGRAGLTAAGALALVCQSGAVLAAAYDFSALDPSRLNLDVAVSSDYVVHGVTRSQGNPIVQAQLGWVGGRSGWTAGVWLSTLDLNPGPGPRHEVDPYIGKRWALDRNWSLRTYLTRYMFRPHAARVGYDYTELQSALSFRDTIEVGMTWSPDYSGYSLRGVGRDGAMLTYEASARFPATRWLSLNAGVGRRDLQAVYRAGYWYWSAGAETAFNRMSFAVSYIGTSQAAIDLYGAEYAGDRMVATIALRLQ